MGEVALYSLSLQVSSNKFLFHTEFFPPSFPYNLTFTILV